MDKEKMKICSVLGEGTVIEGDYRTKGAVRLDGVIHGNVTIEGILILGVSGRINGNITALGAVIGGDVIGNLEIRDKLELMSTAKVVGDIVTGGIVIDENALFQGRCSMNQDEASIRNKLSKPSRRDAKSAKRSAQDAVNDAMKGVRTEIKLEDTSLVDDQ